MRDNLEQLQILIVDDDADAVRLLHSALANYFKQGVEIFTAEGTSSALTTLANLKIDVVVTDLDMDDVNGFHLLRKIKSNHPLVQVIIITSHESPNAIRSALQLGTDDYFLKPFQPAQLIDSVLFLQDRLRRWQQSGLLDQAESPIE